LGAGWTCGRWTIKGRARAVVMESSSTQIDSDVHCAEFLKPTPALQTNSVHFPAPRELTASADVISHISTLTCTIVPRRKFYFPPAAKRTRLVHFGGGLGAWVLRSMTFLALLDHRQAYGLG
jgi:hypothetical protein